MADEDPVAACVTALVAASITEQQATALCGQFAYSADTAGFADSLTQTNQGLNTLYLLSTGALVFVMHAGFAMVSRASRHRTSAALD